MKLVTWNTQWCQGIDGRVSVRRIVDGVKALAGGLPDVLCLQEIAQNYPKLARGAARDQPAALAKLLPGFQLFFGAAVDEFEGSSRRRFGNLIATRLPVLQVCHHALPWPADDGARSMPRLCTVVTIDAPGFGPLRIMTTHLEYYSGKARLAQARALRALHAEACALAADPPQQARDGLPFQAKPHTPHAILCGDFNMDSADPGYAAITKGLKDCWRAVHGRQPQPPTFRIYEHTYGDDPIACDFVFASAGVAARAQRVEIDGITQVSDHQPVFVEFE